MNFRKRVTDQEMGLQMAPMIDIMFLLLIFFMTATFLAQWETKVDITVPTADSGSRAQRDHGEIIINLDDAGGIFINNVQKSPSELKELLREVADIFKDQPVIIRADKGTRHEKVMEVLDVCRLVDIWNVAFATLPQK